jgi:hypothetical protein
MKNQRMGVISAITYSLISLVAAGIFFAITMAGEYSWVARIGGSAWIFILSMIISMPIITSYYKRKFQTTT